MCLLLLYCFIYFPGSPIQFREDYMFSESAEGWLKLHWLPATWSDAKFRCHAEGSLSTVATGTERNNLKSEAIHRY